VGDLEGELEDYKRVLELDRVPDETRLRAHFNRGITRMERGDRLGAVQDLVVVRDHPQAPREAVRGAERYLEDLNH
jgi:hypothetical protein